MESENPELMARISQATSTKERLRLYFDYYKNKEIEVDKLAVIAKTREWTRALRYVRSDYGMDIEYVPKNNSKGVDKDCYIYHYYESLDK